ncbi:hypothetical protein IW140_006513 [Coemansia sp. RSA 1813]|nr:hypothetical protein EV179_006382 [Coemansia sp. RSA 487]KAJ2561932.1 hypothetical protein IW140_006513 [Coemansia sp. RSA 1813]
MPETKPICGKPTLKQTPCKRLVVDGRDCCTSHLPEPERLERKANRVRVRTPARNSVKTLKNENKVLADKIKILEIKYGALLEAFTGMRINENSSRDTAAKSE